jgi:transposase-like protein
MNYRDAVHRTKAIPVDSQLTEAILAPKACPFCDSADVTTTSKSVDVSTYWRCTACGQIWNFDRVHTHRSAAPVTVHSLSRIPRGRA